MEITLELHEIGEGFDCTITLEEFEECCIKIWSEMMIPVQKALQ